MPAGSGSLVFDRLDNTPSSDATWMWSGSCWSQEPGFGGHPVFGSALASDSSDASVVAYGGWGAPAPGSDVSLHENRGFPGGGWGPRVWKWRQPFCPTPRPRPRP